VALVRDPRLVFSTLYSHHDFLGNRVVCRVLSHMGGCLLVYVEGLRIKGQAPRDRT